MRYGSPLAQFGRNMPQLVSKIQAASAQFKGQVVGPIGQYVKLRDNSGKRWLTALDTIFGSRLQSFVLSVLF